MTPNTVPYEDYRRSHQGKGLDYNEKFSHYPHRSVAWGIEQRILLGILHARFPTPGAVRLLDFACGTGRILRLFEDRVGTSTGVDVADSMLQVAQATLTRSELLLADVTRSSSFDNRRFDLITAFRFFPNAEHALRDSAMAKLASLLASDGLLIFNNHLRCTGTTMRARRVLQRLGRPQTERRLHCMSDSEVEQLVATHGLHIVERHHLALMPVLKEKRSFLPQAVLTRIEEWAADNARFDRFFNTKIYVVQSGTG